MKKSPKKSSPQKGKVSPKKGRASPKKRRGRPKKGSSSNLPKSSLSHSRKQDEHEQRFSIFNENSNSNCSEQDTENQRFPSNPAPTFCGKSSLPEIRPLIKAGFFFFFL